MRNFKINLLFVVLTILIAGLLSQKNRYLNSGATEGAEPDSRYQPKIKIIFQDNMSGSVLDLVLIGEPSSFAIQRSGGRVLTGVWSTEDYRNFSSSVIKLSGQLRERKNSLSRAAVTIEIVDNDFRDPQRYSGFISVSRLSKLSLRELFEIGPLRNSMMINKWGAKDGEYIPHYQGQPVLLVPGSSKKAL